MSDPKLPRDYGLHYGDLGIIGIAAPDDAPLLASRIRRGPSFSASRKRSRSSSASTSLQPTAQKPSRLMKVSRRSGCAAQDMRLAYWSTPMSLAASTARVKQTCSSSFFAAHACKASRYVPQWRIRRFLRSAMSNAA